MSVYVVTGAARGLGYEFISQLATQEASNTVFGLVRNVAETKAKIAKSPLAENNNIHIIECDIADRASVEAARNQIAKLSGGKIDVLINNAAYIAYATIGIKLDGPLPADKVQGYEDEQKKSFEVNAIGVINTSLIFSPLLLNGTIKKVLTISSAMGDVEFVNDVDSAEAASYAISKAAANMAVMKMHKAFAPKGVLHFAVSPGVVDTGNEMSGEIELPSKFMAFRPNWKGPLTPETSVKMVLDVLDKATIEKDGGKMVSHFGNREWLEM